MKPECVPAIFFLFATSLFAQADVIRSITLSDFEFSPDQK